MAGIAGWHRRDRNRNTDFRFVDARVTFFTLDLLHFDVLLVREHQISLRQ
jgi:hypothetical protein